MAFKQKIWICLIVFGMAMHGAFGANVVIELLVKDQDNLLWNPKNKMHLTLGHVKNVDATAIEDAVKNFNQANAELLKNCISKGFIVRSFNTNGFGAGHHLLDADATTTQCFDEINQKLYDFLRINQRVLLADKTTPKTVNPKGYVPHLEYLERKEGKIPQPGDILHFTSWQLIPRVQLPVVDKQPTMPD